MGPALPAEPGKLVALWRLPSPAWQALERDLLSSGWLLEDVPDPVSWRAVWAMWAAAPEGSSVREYRVRLLGPERFHTHEIEYLAGLRDDVRLLIWLTGGANGDRPVRVPRPGEEPEKPAGQRAFGSAADAVTVDEFHERWSQPWDSDMQETTEVL